jgi:hypothetical protein
MCLISAYIKMHQAHSHGACSGCVWREVTLCTLDLTGLIKHLPLLGLLLAALYRQVTTAIGSRQHTQPQMSFCHSNRR